MTNHVAAPTVTHVCNHKTHGLRFVFCSGTKHKSESLFLCFKYELQVRLVCNQHLLSWKHTACLETLVYQKFLTIYGSFNPSMLAYRLFREVSLHWSVKDGEQWCALQETKPAAVHIHIFNWSHSNHKLIFLHLLTDLFHKDFSSESSE